MTVKPTGITKQEELQVDFNYSDFFERLRQRGINLSEEHCRRITQKINHVLNYEPRIGFFGKTGTGKSSLCNALFSQDIAPISDIEACTRNTQEILLGIGKKGIKLIDVPGVGESQYRDQEYSKLYAELIPELDVVLWLLKGDDRAFSTDENFYKKIVKPHIKEGKPFFIVLNQVDKIEPFREWNVAGHLPSEKQFQNIKSKVSAIAGFFELEESEIIPVSAAEQYNLVHLVDRIVFALPKDKKVTVARVIKPENISGGAKTSAETDFWETVWKFVEGVIPLVGVVGQAVKFFKGIFNW